MPEIENGETPAQAGRWTRECQFPVRLMSAQRIKGFLICDRDAKFTAAFDAVCSLQPAWSRFSLFLASGWLVPVTQPDVGQRERVQAMWTCAPATIPQAAEAA
jgi:hypothetical protein